jgi:hypothetical protein
MHFRSLFYLPLLPIVIGSVSCSCRLRKRKKTKKRHETKRSRTNLPQEASVTGKDTRRRDGAGHARGCSGRCSIVLGEGWRCRRGDGLDDLNLLSRRRVLSRRRGSSSPEYRWGFLAWTHEVASSITGRWFRRICGADVVLWSSSLLPDPWAAIHGVEVAPIETKTRSEKKCMKSTNCHMHRSLSGQEKEYDDN